MEIDTKIAELADTYQQTPKSDVSYDFNILEETHADENAHTRILVRLLRHPLVGRSFLEFLARRFELLQLVPDAGSTPQIDCFSEYVDARISFGEKVVIVENKVKDAIDQDAQIDRYVLNELKKGTRPENVFVVYLTKNGQKVISASSLSNAREVLGCNEKCMGRFLAVNYRDHIIPWLKSGLRLSIEEERREPYLVSGITQYVHYLQGPEVLDVRASGDARAEKRNALSRCLDGLSSAEIVYLATVVKQLQLSRVCAAVLSRDVQRFAVLTEPERREVIKRLFTGAVGMALADDELYHKVDLFASADVKPSFGVFALNRWVDTSLLQLDVWNEEGPDADAYRRSFEPIRQQLNETGVPVYLYDYNGCPAMRCNIDDCDSVVKVLRVLGRDVSQWSGETSKLVSEMDRLAQVCVPEFCEDLVRTMRLKVSDEMAAQMDDLRWKSLSCSFGTVDYTYPWQQGWAIQLNESFIDNNFVRAVDFFPARGHGSTPELMRQLFMLSSDHPYGCYHWNGRTVFRFPVVELEEAVDLCCKLHSLRKTM